MRALAQAPANGEPAADLPAQPTSAEWRAARGAADSAGLRLRHHDPALHERLAPGEPRARALFDRLEAARWQALGARMMPGILHNLAGAMAQRLDRLGLLRAHLAAQMPLAEALPMLALTALLDRREPLIESGAMDMWHRFAAAHFATELTVLREHLDDQAQFAAAAGDAIRAMFTAMEWDGTPHPPREDARAEGVPTAVGAAPDDAAGQGAAAEAEEAGRGAAGAEARPVAPQPYRAFSSQFDRTAEATDLATPGELADLRGKLDRSLGDARTATAKLANRLQRQLMARARTAWRFDLEEGVLDSARLSRIVVEPGTPLSFKQEQDTFARDTVVGLLIDNSGSMRGRPIMLAAMAADLAARALERCGVACEVLGFTTQSWRGGRSARAWAAAGRPAGPGRLGDLLHVVYKAAATPYRQARLPIALMLRDDLLRENVDGEALLWAAARLRARPERRRLLLVISDGAPNERATMEANQDALFLDRHLRTVVQTLESQGQIELSAIGIRHRVDRIFRSAVVVDDEAGIGPALLTQLARSLTDKYSAAHRPP
jgi:cobaltochelatase CobT